MAKFSLNKPNFSVCFEPGNSLIRINWSGNVTEEELKVGYEAALEVLTKHPVQRILIDTAKRKLEKVSNPDHIFEELFNRALKLIGDTLFLALVVSPEEFYLSTEVSRFGNYEKLVNNHIIVERFLSRIEAEAWLASLK